MSRLIRSVLGLMALSVGAPGSARAAEHFARIGPWDISSYDDTLCSAEAGAGDIGFSIQRLKDGRWWMGLSNSAWNLPPEDRSVGALVVVGTNSILAQARSLKGELILIEVNDLAPLGPFHSDQRIDLMILGGENGLPDQTVRLPLPDIEAVISAVSSCAAALQ